jgi:biopolymer transport protein ExbD
VARRSPLTSLQQVKEINLTPLIDLTFLLLITFIITFPLIEQGIPVNLPSAEAKDLTPDQARTITVDEQGRVYLDDSRVTLEQLDEKLRNLVRVSPQATVMVRADEAIRYGTVVDVLQVLHKARITRMALVTQPESNGAP